MSIAVWKPERKPSYMDSKEKDFLTGDYIKKAVMNLSYEGLQLCAAGYFLAMTKLHVSPAEICQLLEES